MTNLVSLHFDRSDVRMLMLNGVPWWVLIDVCAVLEIQNASRAAQRLEDYQKGITTTYTLGGPQSLLIVNEPGIYALTLSSRKPEAKLFAKWLFTEVIPSIRQFGTFPPPQAVENGDFPALEPLRAPEGTTPTQRFLEEVDRMADVMGTTPDKLLGVLTSVQTVRMMRLHGEGLSSILKKADKLEAMGSAGFDMPYILRGERSMTRDERALVSQLRTIEATQRAAVFHRFAAQLPALAAPSDEEIEDA